MCSLNFKHSHWSSSFMELMLALMVFCFCEFIDIHVQLSTTIFKSVRKENTQTQEGGELCCKIFAIFWRTGLGPVCKYCSWTAQKQKFSEKEQKKIMDTGFLCGNTSSPTEVKKSRPTSCRIFTHFTIRPKTHYKVTHLVITCNLRNHLPKDRLPHVQNLLIKDTSKSPPNLGHTHVPHCWKER